MEIGSSERKPGLPEVLGRARKHGEIHTVMPAVVVSYDARNRRVNVKPLIKEAYLTEEDGRVVRSWAVIPNVPIEWPGAGGYVLTFPISDGKTTMIDGVIPPATMGSIKCSERSLDRWLSGTGGEVDPEIDHNHDLTDAIFTPELRPFGGTYPSTPADHVVLGKDGGIQIHLRGTAITVGDEAMASFMARADKTDRAIATLANLLDGIFGNSSAPLATPVPTSPDPVYVAMKAAIGLLVTGGTWLPGSVAATQGKVQ